MNKDAAIQSFFESFSLGAYPASSVPADSQNKPDFPYITYTAATDSDFERVTVIADVWYRSTKWTEINAKVAEISAAVGQQYTLPCDNGGIIIRKATPFAQPVGDPDDNMIKRKMLMFEFMFVTTY